MKHEILNKLGFEITPEQETKLQGYVDLLLKWNKTYNLIGRSTEQEVWERHILDSAQLVPHVAGAKTLLDFGCGAGLPSVVLAILTNAKITACERIQKKTDFIKEVRRQLSLEGNLTVCAQDVREFLDEGTRFEVITARAVAPLVDLVEWTDGLLDKQAEDPRYTFLKGAELQQELDALKDKYNMTAETFSSITSSTGEIITLRS